MGITVTELTYTVLLVDDTSSDREQYRRYLRADSSCTYHFLEAASVAAGLQVYQSAQADLRPAGRVDAILLDYSLPDAYGLVFLEALQAQNDDQAPPVIMITGSGDQRIATQAMKLGAADYLVKEDLTPGLLQRTIRSAIELARSRQQLQHYHGRLELMHGQMTQIWESMTDAYVTLDRDWRIAYANQIATKIILHLTHLNTPAYLGRILWDMFPRLIGQSIEAAFYRAVTEQVPVHLEICYDTTGDWFEIHAYPSLVGLGIYFRDITDRKQAEQKLQESEERLKAGVQVAGVGLARFDYATNQVELSLEAAALYGFPISTVSRAQIHATFHPDERDQLEVIIAQVLDPQGTGWFARDHRVVWPNGEVRSLSVRKQVFFAQSEAGLQPDYAILAAIDITERQEIQAQLEERNRELDNFVYIVSHDLKAPLRGISNLSQWIEDDLEGSLAPEIQEQMTLLRSRVSRMSTTIDGLLDYARIGRTGETIELVSVNELLAETIDSLAPPSGFTIVVSPSLPTFKANRLLLCQVFANLISNSIKHHDRSDGKIHISSQECSDSYRFIVADDGPGIDPQHHDKIFAIFQAVNPQSSPDSTGIGLSIVKKIVETAGGSIQLESAIGKGSTFSFTWPKQSCPT
jgi:PAS domain S-box-containing protein